MARVVILGFEWNALSDAREMGWRNTPTAVGSPTIDATTVRSGSYSLKVSPGSGAAEHLGDDGSGDVGGYHKFYVRFTTFPSVERTFYGKSTTLHLTITATGAVKVLNNTTLIGTSSTLLTDTAKWYCIEFRLVNGTSVTVLKIDGTNEVTGSPSSWTATMRFGSDDTGASAFTAYYDDVVRDDAAFPGQTSIVLLRPISHNNIGTWTAGAGGTTNIWDAVDNRPAAGVASAGETDTTNIECATNSATADCDLNMTSYTTAGIVAGSTIVAVQASVRHGEDIATGTKNGAFTIVSNPTQSGEDTFTYGGDAGAHGAEVGNWSYDRGTVQASPSVTLGTSPVLRVGKRTATTRVVCVDAMGIYVEYTAPSVTTEYVAPVVQQTARGNVTIGRQYV